MDQLKFKTVCDKIINIERAKCGIGTLGEKTLHSILKHYFEENEKNHEIKISSFFADIKNDNGITEIQTRNFDKLRKKLQCFLENETVTLLFPVADIKWLLWIDMQTGEVTKKRKSPKRGKIYDIFSELYKIKQYLDNPSLKLCIVMLELYEYRYLNGWSKDKKKGSRRCDRIPVDLLSQVQINNINDYHIFLPENLKFPFTSKDYKKATGLSMRNAQTALNILNFLKIVRRTAKQGNLFLYDRETPLNTVDEKRVEYRY